MRHIASLARLSEPEAGSRHGTPATNILPLGLVPVTGDGGARELDGSHRGLSRPAWELQLLATAVSAVRDHPGFVPDEYLRTLTGSDLGCPGAGLAALPGELCAAGLWERADGGYLVLDAKAVQACVDRVRELREQDAAKRARGPVPERLPDTPREAGAPGVTRFGERVTRGTAASFRCAACGEMAAVVKVARAGTSVDMGPPIGRETYDHDGLVVDYFLGTAWHAASGEALDAAQAILDDENPDPLALRQLNPELAPFYCPDCGLNYRG